ncbi:MFS transporter [Sphingopyxis indica]|uniref:MFS transporter n=1 Tax=Sphingopyxis indica TaxID=436663 RepID=UPI00293926BC|nr:MFS transporter [Sphingopyxis indica]WOF43071.1 MFS transporter [Sphingopyxis indica]
MTSIPAPCDAAMAATAARKATRHSGAILVATILASSLSFVDGSVVNVGLAAIGNELRASPADLQWVVNAYLLPLSALLLLGGAAGDLYGRRRMFLWGVGAFGVASILCAAAPSLGWLIVGRAVQGISAAMLLPNSLASLGAAFTGEERGKAIGTWAAAGAAAGAIGPLVGGALIDLVGWRAIFLVNLPLVLGALWLGARYLPESHGEGGSKLDWPGAILATIGLGALTWGLTILSGQAAMRGGGWAVAIGATALLLFIWAERKRGDRAMMPLGLFATRSYIGLSILTLLLYGALGGLFVLLPFLLIEAGGYSAVQAGAALLPLSIVIGLASRAMGTLAARIGPRLPLTIGPLIVAGGFLLLSRVDPNGSYWTSVMPGLLVVAIGMAGAAAPLTTAVMNSVDERHVGAANGANSALARTGGLVATALVGSVIASRGAVLVHEVAVASLVAAAMSAAAGCAALLLLEPERMEPA